MHNPHCVLWLLLYMAHVQILGWRESLSHVVFGAEGAAAVWLKAHDQPVC